MSFGLEAAGWGLLTGCFRYVVDVMGIIEAEVVGGIHDRGNLHVRDIDHNFVYKILLPQSNLVSDVYNNSRRFVWSDFFRDVIGNPQVDMAVKWSGVALIRNTFWNFNVLCKLFLDTIIAPTYNHYTVSVQLGREPEAARETAIVP